MSINKNILTDEYLSKNHPLYHKWSSEINNFTNNSLTNIVDLYHKTGILIPTLEKNILKSSEDKKNYFNKLLSKKNINVTTSSIVSEDINKLTKQCYGIYNFNFIDNNNKAQTISARFNFIFTQNSKEKWLIKIHHSSKEPN